MHIIKPGNETTSSSTHGKNCSIEGESPIQKLPNKPSSPRSMLNGKSYAKVDSQSNICFSSIIQKISKSYHTFFAIAGITLLVSGIIVLIVAINCPSAIAMAFSPALSVTGTQVLGGFSIGFGLLVSSNALFFSKENKEEITPQDTNSLSA
jgi:hypothetical protein